MSVVIVVVVCLEEDGWDVFRDTVCVCVALLSGEMGDKGNFLKLNEYVLGSLNRVVTSPPLPSPPLRLGSVLCFLESRQDRTVRLNLSRPLSLSRSSLNVHEKTY